MAAELTDSDQSIPEEAAVDLHTTGQYRVVTCGTTGIDGLAGANAAVATIAGILIDDPKVGETGSIMPLGTVTKCTIAAAVTRRAKLKTATGGKLTPVTTTGDNIVAIALEAGSGDGSRIRVQFDNFGTAP